MGEVLQGHFKKLIGPIGFWQKERHTECDSSRRVPRRPQQRDMSGGLTANAETLYGLYYGTIPELQFASPMAYTPLKSLLCLWVYPLLGQKTRRPRRR
jgi:hypothetical protein